MKRTKSLGLGSEPKLRDTGPLVALGKIDTNNEIGRFQSRPRQFIPNLFNNTINQSISTNFEMMINQKLGTCSNNLRKRSHLVQRGEVVANPEVLGLHRRRRQAAVARGGGRGNRRRRRLARRGLGSGAAHLRLGVGVSSATQQGIEEDVETD